MKLVPSSGTPGLGCAVRVLTWNMQILPLYASILTLLYVALSIRTLRLRRTLRIAIGDAGNERMLRAMRVHSNFAEYVPLGLIMIYLVETLGAQPLLVHGLCLCLLAGPARRTPSGSAG